MKTERFLKLFGLALLCLCGGGIGSPALAQTSATIDFDGAAAFTDLPTYSEDGFTLTPSVGNVRVNNAFAPFSNAAQPSFGFGQGFDSSFTFTNDLRLPFSLLSIDLLEATVFPAAFGVTLLGTRSNPSLVTQTFTLDGIAGAQTFVLPPSFSDLISLRIGEDAANGFFIDIVQIDNVRLMVIPEPGTWLWFGLSTVVIALRGFLREATEARCLPRPPSLRCRTVLGRATGRLTTHV